MRDDVLNSETFKTLSETKMSAAVAAAMNYITKRGDSITPALLQSFLSNDVSPKALV